MRVVLAVIGLAIVFLLALVIRAYAFVAVGTGQTEACAMKYNPQSHMSTACVIDARRQ